MKLLVLVLAVAGIATASAEIVAQTPSAVPENRDETPWNRAIRQIRSIGREGSGAIAAGRAVRSLSESGAARIPALLHAFDDANPLARNLLRAVVESIADRANGHIPVSALAACVQNPQAHDPHARGLAFDLLRRAAPAEASRLAPGMLYDPNPDLRRRAVARAISRAKRIADAGDANDAQAAYEAALGGAIDRDQVGTIVDALSDFGRRIDLQRHFGFIAEWRIAGPFDNTDHAGFDAVFPPETEYQPNARYHGKLGEVAWQSISTEDPYGVVDIAKSLENYKGSVMYLTATFESDSPQDAQIRLGTQNAWKLWLNGEFLFGHEEYHRGMIMDQHRIPIQLDEGRNRILLKLLQDEQPDDWAQSYEFQLRITDPTGAAIGRERTVNPVRAPKPTTTTPMPKRAARGLASRDEGLLRLPDTGRPLSAESVPNRSQSGGISSEWTCFRGPGGAGQVADADPPVEWDDSDPPGWSTDLPGRGFSQPVVAGGLIFTTCSSGFAKDHLHVVCHDFETGRRLWHRQYWATGRTTVPPDNRVATPTPVVASDRLYCLFSSGDLACLNHQGLLLWYRGLGHDYPRVTNNLGMASSPLLADGALVCQLETDSQAIAIGLDAETGANKWKIDRFHKANWTSPIPHDRGDGTSVLLEGADGVQAVDAATGKTLWRHDCRGSTVSSMTRAGDRLLVPAGGLTTLDLAGRDSAGTRLPPELWHNQRLACSFVSPVVAGGRVYIINSAGVLRCAEVGSGEMLWQARLHGSFWGTPSAAAGRIYCPSREGTLAVVDLVDDPGTILAEHEIGEGLFSPPVLVRGSILLRTDTRLIRIVQQ